MAGSDSKDGSFDVATWRVVVLFIAILIIDTAWEYADNKITTRIRLVKHKGLLHAWEQLKFEVMALGLISLLLVVFEVCVSPQHHAQLHVPAACIAIASMRGGTLF